MFAKYGLDVEPRITNGGAVVLAGLAGGSYDVAYTNLVPVLQAHAHGLPFQIVAPVDDVLERASAERDARGEGFAGARARDLDGKTIGTQSLQDLNSVAMRAWIDKNGGDSSSIHVLEVPSAAAVAALTSHRIDAMALSEPLLTEALETGKVRVFAEPAKHDRRALSGAGFVVDLGFRRPTPRRPWRALHARCTSRRSTTTRTWRKPSGSVSSFSDVPADIIARSVRSIDGEYVSPQYIQPLIDFAAKYGMIPHAFPAEEIISPVAVKPR